MSWSIRESGVVINDIVIDRLEALAIKSAKEQNPDGEDQVQLAMTVVNDILRSGVLGNTTKKYTIALNGHGNPGHEPKSGWVNDHITITIQQES